MLNTCKFFSSYLFILFVGLLPHVSFSQDRCGTMEYSKILNRNNASKESDQQFEEWLQKKMEDRRNSGILRTQATYTIPVVVHIIHNGEPIGTGANISDAQVVSQLSVLNKDFKRLNADASSTPAEFLPVAGSIDLEFVLAKQDPEGLPTSGIVRVNGAKSGWVLNDNYQLKSLSYWPSENYLNLWVCNLTDYLGYAQFPESNLSGLENASKNKLTDGVVIAAEAFGSIDDGPFALDPDYNKGRTATHEVAHFFGLRHIWGDDSNTCTGTDYVDDTPNQAGSSSGCPSHPRKTCDVNSMFQNFLDYTDDDCMNIFTIGQIARMTTILENSIRRKTLITSVGSQVPVQFLNDLGIRKIVTPAGSACINASLTPALEVRNYGTNTITSFRIRLRKDGAIIESRDFSVTLNLLEATTVTFVPINYTTGGGHSITFEVLLTNGLTDGNSANNIVNQTITVPLTTPTPIAENFNFAIPGTWSIINPDQNLTWTLATAPNVSASNKAMKMDFYNYIDNQGEIDIFQTGVFNLSAAPVAALKFDVSYPKFSNDELRVIVLTGCNTDINQGTVVYNKAGSALSTTTSSSPAFVPGGQNDWRKESVDLTPYLGQSSVQLAFVGLNDFGNNLYLDNISLLTSQYEDITLSAVSSPAPVTCATGITPKLVLTNNGTEINSFKVVTTFNGNSNTTAFTGYNFTSGTLEIELPPLTLNEGENLISFNVIEPNGVTDKSPADNTRQTTIIVTAPEDYIPLREGFENSFEDLWTIANPMADISWQSIDLGSNQAIYFNAFNSNVSGDEAWLVSPILDFSTLLEARMFYDISYGYRAGTSDHLRVLASINCEETFDLVLMQGTGSSIKSADSEVAWEPSVESDWRRRESIILSSLVGVDNVRIAFVFTNANGNNIYLDNIEFFPSSDPSPPVVDDLFSVYPNPSLSYEAVNITFNLEAREEAYVTFTDTLGKIFLQAVYPDALNQTIALSVQDFKAGMYIVSVQTKERTAVQKFIVLK